MKNIKAKYYKQPFKQLENNPLAEAIKIETDAEKLKCKVTKSCITDLQCEELPLVYKNLMIQELSQLHIPLPQLTSIYTKFAALILHSYLRRGPFTPESTAIKSRLGNALHRKTEFNQNLFIQRTTAPSVLIHGLSGSGKTTTIRYALNCFPQTIEHSSYKGRSYKQTQLVWVSFDLPATSSIKALALNFFQAIDNATGTDYYPKWQSKSRLSVDQHLNAIRLIAETHELGLVHIDEIQFMLSYAKSKDTPTLNVIEALFNKLGIPVVLSCTSSALTLFRPDTNCHTLSPNITTTRRMCNDREFVFGIHKMDSKYFNELFIALFHSWIQWFKKEDIEKFKFYFHNLSCGLPAIMTRLAQLFFEIKFDLIEKKPDTSSKSSIDDECKLLLSVFKNQFSLIEPALQMLRNDNFEGYEQKIRNTPHSSAKYTDKEQKIAKKKEALHGPAVLKKERTKFELNTPFQVSDVRISTGFQGSEND